MNAMEVLAYNDWDKGQADGNGWYPHEIQPEQVADYLAYLERHELLAA